MAQYRAIISGQRGEASRLGSKSSGIRASVNGWDIGAQVYISFNEQTGKDVVTIYKTSGSNGRFAMIQIAEYSNE